MTLFDTGPDSQSLVRNITAMQVPVHRIERVITSHWHSDHTGGLLSFLAFRNATSAGPSSHLKSCTPPPSPCVVDVHPDRPIARGIAPRPNYDKVMCILPPDPTFEGIEESGGVVERYREGHAVANGTVWVSGEIPRRTEYETGLLGGMRWVEEGGLEGKWMSEPVSRRLSFISALHFLI